MGELHAARRRACEASLTNMEQLLHPSHRALTNCQGGCACIPEYSGCRGPALYRALYEQHNPSYSFPALLLQLKRQRACHACCCLRVGIAGGECHCMHTNACMDACKPSSSVEWKVGRPSQRMPCMLLTPTCSEEGPGRVPSLIGSQNTMFACTGSVTRRLARHGRLWLPSGCRAILNWPNPYLIRLGAEHATSSDHAPCPPTHHAMLCISRTYLRSLRCETWRRSSPTAGEPSSVSNARSCLTQKAVHALHAPRNARTCAALYDPPSLSATLCKRENMTHQASQPSSARHQPTLSLTCSCSKIRDAVKDTKFRCAA